MERWPGAVLCNKVATHNLSVCMFRCSTRPCWCSPAVQIVGRTSSWIDPDSSDAGVSSSSCAALQQQLSWAAFLGLQAVLLPPPWQLDRPFNYAQVVNQVRGVCLCSLLLLLFCSVFLFLFDRVLQ